MGHSPNNYTLINYVFVNSQVSVFLRVHLAYLSCQRFVPNKYNIWSNTNNLLANHKLTI